MCTGPELNAMFLSLVTKARGMLAALAKYEDSTRNFTNNENKEQEVKQKNVEEGWRQQVLSLVAEDETSARWAPYTALSNQKGENCKQADYLQNARTYAQRCVCFELHLHKCARATHTRARLPHSHTHIKCIRSYP